MPMQATAKPGTAPARAQGLATPTAQRAAPQPRGLRQRIRHWWQSRQPRTDALGRTHRNVYILPTRAGALLALTLLVLLVASINYQLNLGYLLTFLLAGSTIAAMHVGHATLRGLALSLSPPQPQFLGAAVSMEVHLASDSPRARYGMGLACEQPGQPVHWSWTDVEPRGSARLTLAFQPGRRGLQPLPALTVMTRFPIGAFRVWTVWRPASQVLVYPAPELHAPPLPPGEPRPGQGVVLARDAGAEFDGVRPYRRGDPLRQIVWKKAAKSDELVSRDAREHQRHELWLDAARTGLADHEARLSRLCAWVLAADAAGLDYGLRVGAHEVPPDAGEAHRRRCLEVLALC